MRDGKKVTHEGIKVEFVGNIGMSAVCCCGGMYSTDCDVLVVRRWLWVPFHFLSNHLTYLN